MTPSFQEALISQVPALRVLQQLGFTYLSPEECAVERKGRMGRVLLEDVLATQLKRLNKISFKGREVPFSDENIAKATEALRDLPFEGLVRTSEKVYDLLTLGKSLDQTIDDETKGFTLRYIDWLNPRNTSFHVTAEFEVERTGSRETRRPDNEGAAVITTVLFKFGAAANAKAAYSNGGKDIFVLVDESHRSEYGEANIKMLKALPNACYIGFTGTPLTKKEKNTATKFGGFIRPSYTIRDAVADEAVVPLLFEGRHILQTVNQAAVDKMFEALCEGLTPEQRADLKRKFASKEELIRLDGRLYLVAWDVSQHFAKTWKGTGFKGQLTAPGKKEAIALKRLLDSFGKVTSEVIISGPTEIENPEEHDKAESDQSVELFWKAMMAKYGNEKEYNRQIINAFKKGDEPELLIVVDKLLTGFDAPRNVVLYIARGLKEHTLLQAIARVNRLYPGKDFGYIIDYYGVVTQLHEALELYSSLEDKFDREDLEGALSNISEELKALPSLHDAVWDCFKEVKNKKDEEAFELALEDKDKRDEFYTRLSRFCRVLKMALSSIEWVTATPTDKAERYKHDAGFFQKLRASVKLRYAEEIDYRDYEKQIQKMLNTYVQADEVIQVVAPVNIFEREAFEAEVEKAQSPRAKADTIANRTKKTITEKMDEDPFFYRKFSVLLQLIIDDYKAARLSEAQYLAKVTAIMEQVRDGKAHDGPDMLRDKDLARAVYGAIKEHLAEPEPTPPPKRIHEALGPQAGSALPKPDDLLMAEAACEIETIIRNEAVVRWRDNTDAQNRMRNAMDDYLFKFAQERGVAMTLQQMDEIIESALHIARNRPQDA